MKVLPSLVCCATALATVEGAPSLRLASSAVNLDLDLDLEGNHSPQVSRDPWHNETYGYPTDYYGVDISQSYGKSTFDCLKGLNLRFAIIRCYQSIGRVDPACAGSAAAANAAGLDTHAYMFPDPRRGGPSTQLKELLAYWEQNHVNVKRLWLDIEGPQYWTSSTSSNQAFYKGLVDACRAEGLKCGVYSSASQWEPIFGSRDFSYGSDMPLWFADYDGVPSFNNWAHFGGWSGPTLKQFTDKGDKCGCNYDISWGPSLP